MRTSLLFLTLSSMAMITGTALSHGGLVGRAVLAHTPSEAPSGEPSIEHKYQVTGVGENGKKYTGTASFSKIGGEMYNATWHLSSNTFHGVCYRDNNHLSCCSAVNAGGLGVLAYLVTQQGLSGVWFQEGGSKLGKEFLTPKGAMDKAIVGRYTISKGVNPDGSTYSGTAVIQTPLRGVYTFNWVIGSTKVKGIGVRVTGEKDDVIAAGFDPGGDYSVLQYDVADDGRTLSGVWAQSLGGNLSTGTEDLSWNSSGK